MEFLEKCVCCNSADIEEKWKVKDRHYGNQGLFSEYICNSCKLVFLNPMYSDEELAKFYPDDSYYSYYFDIENQKQSKISKLKNLFRKKEEEKGLKILDIGCGNGWRLYEYKKRGWEVAGVEPSSIACEIGNQHGLNIFNGTLNDAKYDDNTFDYIHSNHSFEHINNPNETLQEIKRILKPTGKFSIDLPNIGGLNAKLFGPYWFYLGAPVHTFNYNPTNLSQLIEKNGLKVNKVDYTSSYVGFLGSLFFYLNRNREVNKYNFLIENKYITKLFELFAIANNQLRIGDCIKITGGK